MSEKIDHVCPECKSNNVIQKEPEEKKNGCNVFFYEICKTNAIIYSKKCLSCDFEFIDWDDKKKMHEDICDNLNLMRPIDLKAFMQEHKLTKAEAANILSIKLDSLNGFLTYDLLITESQSKLLYLLAKYPHLINELRSTFPPSQEGESDGTTKNSTPTTATTETEANRQNTSAGEEAD